MQKGMSFDWDAISTGRPSMNTSSSFFFRGDDGEETEPDTSLQSEEPTEEPVVLQENNANTGTTKSVYEKYERAFRYAQIYAEKRKKRAQEEEKLMQEMKQFHAKPAPNFNVKPLAAKTAVPKFTIPVTPKQMKPERLRKVTAKDQNIPPKTFQAQEAKVLKEEPYKPKLEKKNVVQEPFNLRMSVRLQLRKQFDEQLRKTKEELARKEAEQRRVEEERQLKQLRKQKVFTAKPNPFK